MNIVTYRNWETTNDAKFVGFWVSFSDVELQLTTWQVAMTTDPHWSEMMIAFVCLLTSCGFQQNSVKKRLISESKEKEKLG